jgi:23S rRNA (uracil1939-C5)-methyltransferase
VVSGFSADSAEFEVERLVAGGRGLGRPEGVVWLVDGGVPGDRVRAEASRRRRRLVEGRVVDIMEPSPLRRPPPCRLQGTCGGCPWMVLDEAEQRAWKGRILEEALQRIGGFPSLSADRIAPSPRSLAYRNKLELTFGTRDGRRILGFHETGNPERLVDVDRCLLQDETGSRILLEVRRFFLEGPGRDDPWLDDPPEPARLVIRRSVSTGRALVALRGGPGPFPSAREFARGVRAAVPEVSGVVRLLSRPGRRGGVRVARLLGRPWLEESLGGVVFRLPAPTFFQVNPEAASALVDAVRELAAADPEATALDLYAGVGVYGLTLAEAGASVIACEADPRAVASGQRAARENHRSGFRMVRSDVGTFLASSAARESSPTTVVANPPRTGFGPGVADAIAELRPERIVIVSCDPATLARDLKHLAARGYTPTRVVAVDLFPQTPHIESVTLLRRN